MRQFGLETAYLFWKKKTMVVQTSAAYNAHFGKGNVLGASLWGYKLQLLDVDIFINLIVIDILYKVKLKIFRVLSCKFLIEIV